MSAKSQMQDDHLQSDLGKELDESAKARAATDAPLEQQADLLEETSDDSPDAECSAKELLAASKDRELRLQAEMENLRGRTSREVAQQRRYGALPLVRDLLPVLDNVERAIDAAEKDAEQNTDTGGLLEGFQLVRQQLLAILEQHHCKPIEATGEPFDPQFHEAILQRPSDDMPKDHVLMQSQVGYRMHDRVVRASQVIVSSGPSET